MIKCFRAGEAESLRKSGVEEDYTEMEQLLTDMVEIIDSVDLEKQEKDLQIKKKEEDHMLGLLVRESAMDSLTPVSSLCDSEYKGKRKKKGSHDFGLLVETLKEGNQNDLSIQNLELNVRMEEAKARQMEAKNQAAQI
jgi:hypothetical protein